jgi:predicted DNA-binding transcriptional regulator YafY
MANDRRLKADALIIRLLQRKGSASIGEIRNCLSDNDFAVSHRTMERYIQELRNEYGVVADCDRRTNRYSLLADDAETLDCLLHVIRLVNSSELLMDTIRNRDRNLACIAFEHTDEYAGGENLEPIYSAILNSHIITFTHENFERNTTRQHSIKPYLLKEYNSKWYVVGNFTDSDAIRIFGLDRITDLKVEDDHTFEKTQQKRISTLFDNLIGLVYDIDKTETVEISATPEQAKYFKRSPLHGTQTVVSESDSEVRFSYYLVPNLELQRLLLGFGSRVKVVKPDWFARQMKEEIAAMAGRYKDSSF